MKEELNEYGNIKTEYDNKIGLVTNPKHPHYKSIAISIGVQKTPIGYGMIFKKDDGETFFVFNGRDIEWIN